MGKIIAIFNQKGGVGKSTTTINLGAALVQMGKTVLLVDMDAQGNTTLGVGIDKRELEKTVYDLLTVKKVTMENILEVIKETSYEGLFLLPSNKSLGDAELELNSVMSRETRLKQALNLVKDEFDYILIDCPPSLGLLSLNSLTASDSLIIPIAAEYFAVEGIADLMETFNLVKDSVNPELDIMGVLITMFNSRINLAKDIKGALGEAFGNKVFNTLIRTDSEVKYSQDKQVPLMFYNTKNKKRHAFEDYKHLGEEILNVR